MRVCLAKPLNYIVTLLTGRAECDGHVLVIIISAPASRATVRTKHVRFVDGEVTGRLLSAGGRLVSAADIACGRAGKLRSIKKIYIKNIPELPITTNYRF